MIRNVAGKVVWMARVTTVVGGLAIMLAMVLGMATMALGADGDFFKVGRINVAESVSKLIKSGAGPALELQVDSGPPMKVNSQAKVAKLNSDRLDGVDSTGFYASGSKVADSAHADQANSATNAQNAANADNLDGKDSTALPVTMKTNSDFLDNCTNPTSSGTYTGKCAPVKVTVPAGKQYHVTVLSSFSIKISSTGSVNYCPYVQGLSGTTSEKCLSWEGLSENISLAANYGESATSSGEIGPLPPGTYTFSTFIDANGFISISPAYQAHTTVMVRDASAPGPPIN